jgi:SPP1 gp7 family putative phage head morphogenesis protein
MSTKVKKKSFKPNASAEVQFARALKQVAKNASHLVDIHIDGATIRDPRELERALTAYSEKLGPWAARQSAKMLERVAKKNKTAFRNHSKTIHAVLQTTVAKAAAGKKAAELMAEQIDLIKEIPLRSLDRAQKLAFEAYMNGSRADEVAKELLRTGEVSESDAERIARTEVARSNSVITQVRSQAAGSRQYIWRNSGDASVREAHEFYHGPGHKKDNKLDGVVFSWDSPPTLDDGSVGHPGTFPNCRCYPEPFFPDEE